MNSNMKLVGVEMPKELAARLKMKAAELETTIKALMITIVSEYLSSTLQQKGK